MKYQLDHLNYAVPQNGFGNRLSSYLLALEAWRRGLEVKLYLDEANDERSLLFQISDGRTKHEFKSSQGTLLSEEAKVICNDKDLTKNYLARNNVRTPSWKLFNKNEYEEAYKFAELIGFPLVVKPLSENAGKGVTPEITSYDEFNRAIALVTEEIGDDMYIIEDHIPGDEYRIFMIDNKVVAATKRLPANIVGDGVSSVSELIDKKNKSKKHNPNMSTKIITIDDEVNHSLKTSGFTLNSIPLLGEQVFLRKKSNVSQGGDAIDVTNKLTSEMRTIAEKASAAIPGLTYCGLDMISGSENSPAIIEINTKPMLGLHAFPSEGEAIDVPAMIIDRCFPNYAHSPKSLYYFDFKNIVYLLKRDNASYIPVKPLTELSYSSYHTFLDIVEDSSDETIKNVHNKAKELQLSGTITRHNNRELEIRIASPDAKIVEKFKSLIFEMRSLKQNNEPDLSVPVNLGYQYVRNKAELHTEVERVANQRDKKSEMIQKKNEDIAALKKENKKLVRQSRKLKLRIEELENNQ
ncbi:ATP-grasp domain-containing protein [Salisediminibacterium halotolerans]|uniref:D-alanine-D-alanine ligase n=1 Tax=Salisediminibacterium halotolerans TaxID=517425 RepID=A0A1H9TWV7_9BACI|nr:ATP-grasp domain-containing protein [Salisediminibacterium haloalkalitolerans]SES01521.1 D-alanine-D-alanine ligase [Salisediminibacterium haloalkalitolerans]